MTMILQVIQLQLINASSGIVSFHLFAFLWNMLLDVSKVADALRLHQTLNKPTNKPLEVVRKRSEVTMKDDRCVRWYSDGVIAVKDG